MKTKEYKYIEYTDDNDYVIANVVMDEDKIVSVKLTEDCLTNWHEYYGLIEFLEEIKPVVWKYNDEEQVCDAWYVGGPDEKERSINDKIQKETGSN